MITEAEYLEFQDDLAHADLTVEDFENILEHYGVKGMKWGQKRAVAKSFRAQKKTNNEKFQREISKARGNVASGQVRRDFKAAKKQSKEAKILKGKAESKRIMAKAKDKRWEETMKAYSNRNGKEAVARMLTGMPIWTAG